jgi:uncharacterized protein
MTKLVIFSDIHQDFEALKKIVDFKADVFINLGDLAKGSELVKAGKILGFLKSRLWSIPGNNETFDQHQKFCDKFSFTNLHKNVKKLAGFNCLGFGLSTPTPFNTPGEISDSEYQKQLKSFQGLDNLVLFTHCPPAGTKISKAANQTEAGSQALKFFIENNRVNYCFSGHIHENAGLQDKINNTECYSVGKIGFEFEL